MATILRDAGLGALVERAQPECLASGFQFTEGPLWLGNGSLIFQDIKAERTYLLDANRTVHLLRENTGAANGQTFDSTGAIVFCEQNGRRVSRMARDGSSVETVVENWSGKRLNSPNDIICRSDGLIYFTDPPYGVQPEDRALHFQGLYNLDAARDRPAKLNLLIDDFEKPNGLAFSPDETILYVCDTGRYHVRAFDIQADGTVIAESGRVFAKLDPDRPGGPDGLKVDREGRVYVAVAQGVWVHEPDGRLIGIIELPARPSNLAWCDSDARGLAITAVDSVYYLRLRVEGILPCFPR